MLLYQTDRIVFTVEKNLLLDFLVVTAPQRNINWIVNKNAHANRYIQSLLGHASSKTTEIYTHITTKGFDQIKSPLNKLDVF